MINRYLLVESIIFSLKQFITLYSSISLLFGTYFLKSSLNNLIEFFNPPKFLSILLFIIFSISYFSFVNLFLISNFEIVFIK